MAIQVFNADDHPMLRKGITDLFIETECIQWVGNAKNGKEALDKIRALKPDVAFLDIEMLYYTGLERAKILIDEKIDTAFVLFTLFKDEHFLKNALDMGIMGYLLKDRSEIEIMACIQSVVKGQLYVNASMTKFLIQANKAKNSILYSLSAHEINILKLISKQKTTAEIAHMLFISLKTVGNHRSNIGKKLNLGGEQNGLMNYPKAEPRGITSPQQV